MIHEFRQTIPVITCDNKEGLVLFIKDNGKFENDEWCVVLLDTGEIRHYLSNQIKVYKNSTYGINTTEDDKKV